MRLRLSFRLLIAASFGAAFLLLAAQYAPTAAQSETRAPLGTNLPGIKDYNGTPAFVDMFKSARQWVSQKQGAGWGQGGPLNLTPEGWIASLEPGQYATAIMDNGGYTEAGEYVVLYEGEGKLRFPLGGGTVVSETPGRTVVSRPGDKTFYLEVTETNPANPLRNIRVIMPGYEATYETQIFTPLFLERVSRFDVIRFMDWMETNNSPVETWEDRTRVNSYTQTLHSGVAPEYIVELGNRTGRDVWINIPHKATDDYIRNLAILFRDNINDGIKIYLEYSNETWNGQFSQYGYLRDQGLALGLATDGNLAVHRYHAHRAMRIFEIWEQVFGGRERFVRVFAGQSANSWVGKQIMEYNNAYQNADALAIAPYFNIHPYRTVSVDEIAAVLATSNEDLLNSTIQNIDELIARNIRSNYTEASSKGLQLIAYEGGQHIVGLNEAKGNSDLTRKLHALNRHPSMECIYMYYLGVWARESNGGVFAHFSLSGPWSVHGSWGALEYLAQESSPKWNALQRYINGEVAPLTVQLTANGPVCETAATTGMMGQIALQGRANAASVGVTVEVHQNGTLAGSHALTTNDNGRFNLQNLADGTYTVWVKHNRFLAVTQSVTLPLASSPVDFGALRAGDVNNDNRVTLPDFSALSATFNLSSGAAGYDNRADFNGDGSVTIQDFSLLASNFNATGAAKP